MEENEEIHEEQKRTPCGTEPISPGGTQPGKWKCIDGSWKWIEDIGG